jgi:hypothetical protein
MPAWSDGSVCKAMLLVRRRLADLAGLGLLLVNLLFQPGLA